MAKVNMFPIIKSYEVFLACPNCESNMIADEPRYQIQDGEGWFLYKCPVCGAKSRSQTAYPFQRSTFDLVKRISTTEEELRERDVVC